MELRRYGDAADFLADAGDYLVEREAAHNLILGLSSELPTLWSDEASPPYLAVVRDGKRIVGAALQTPRHNLILSEIEDPVAVATLVDDRWNDELPGVVGPVEPARAFAEAYAARPAWTYRLRGNERIYRLTTVRHPASVPGGMRTAGPADRVRVVRWIEGFMQDAFGEADPADVAMQAERWLGRSERTVYLWDDGATVSMCGVSGPTPNGIRLSLVYTPPEARRRGYASALVAAASQAQLDAGRRFCFLFTDLANPTSNHIYGAIGYEPVRDVDQYGFDRS
jgi:predicted GNAT family acetyltransferase